MWHYRLGSGTTSYSTGVVGIIKLSLTETLLSKYSASLYENLQKKGHHISNNELFYITDQQYFIHKSFIHKDLLNVAVLVYRSTETVGIQSRGEHTFI